MAGHGRFSKRALLIYRQDGRLDWHPGKKAVGTAGSPAFFHRRGLPNSVG